MISILGYKWHLRTQWESLPHVYHTCPVSLWRQFTVSSRLMYKVNYIFFFLHKFQSLLINDEYFLLIMYKCPIRFVTMDIYYNKQTISWSYFLILIFPFSALSTSTQIMLFLGNQITWIAANRGAKQQWTWLNDFFCISSGKVK